MRSAAYCETSTHQRRTMQTSYAKLPSSDVILLHNKFRFCSDSFLTYSNKPSSSIPNEDVTAAAFGLSERHRKGQGNCNTEIELLRKRKR